MKKELSSKFTITNNLIDRYDNLRLSTILDISQEIAGNHAEILGVGYEDFIKKNYIWIVLRNKIEVIKNVKNIHNVEVTTSLAKPRLFEFPRDYIFKYNDEEIIKVRSVWAVYNIKEEKVIVPQEVSCLDTDSLGLFNRVKKLPAFNKEELEYVKSIDVTYSMIDHNGHMNNTRYLDLFFDIFELDKDQYVKTCQIEYVSQCFIHDKLSLYKLYKDNKSYLYGYVDENLKFYMECEIISNN